MDKLTWANSSNSSPGTGTGYFEVKQAKHNLFFEQLTAFSKLLSVK